MPRVCESLRVVRPRNKTRTFFGSVANNDSRFQAGRMKRNGQFWLTRLNQTARRRTGFVLEYFLFLPLQFVPS